MPIERHVRLFRNGRNQALRIPREFEPDAREAIVYREGERRIIQPVKGRWLLSTLASLPTLDEPFADVDAGLLPLDDDSATAGIREAEPSDARALLA